MKLAALAAAILVALGAAWFARYSIAAVPGFPTLLVLDRWTGTVVECSVRDGCQRIFPSP